MRDIRADVDPSWDGLISDIQTQQSNFKQGIATCWEEAIAVLGSSSPRALTNQLFSSLNDFRAYRVRVA